MEHLTVEQQHQSKHDLLEGTEAAAPEPKPNPKLGSTPSPTASIPDDLTYTSTTKSSRGLAGIDADVNDELMIRIDTLEQKLDLLIGKMSKQTL